MEARYDTRCCDCGEPIHVGTRIRRNIVGRWVHLNCATQAPHPPEHESLPPMASLIRKDLPPPLPPRRRQPEPYWKRRRAS